MERKVNYTEVKACRCCGEWQLFKFIDLGQQPLANAYHTGEEESEEEFPLAVNVCKWCWHTQLSVVVNPDLLFKNYSYVSGTSKTLRDYFDWFAGHAIQQFTAYTGRSAQSIRVLDIACNDGSQLDSFQQKGCMTYGVDPATNLFPISAGKGHDVFLDYWSIEVARRFDRTFDIIVAQNVFAHLHDTLGFLIACREVMHDESILYIQTSQRDMYKNGEFDTIYHEHLSFFNTHSMKKVVESAGLYLHNVQHSNIHGGSYVFEIGAHPNPFGNVDRRLIEETKAGLYQLDTYKEFGLRASKTMENLKDTIQELELDNPEYDFAAYGMTAKGMTVLNFAEIKLDFGIDDNPLKQGKLTPGLDIPIYAPDFLKTHSKNIVFLQLAWNFEKEIREKIKTLRPDKKDLFIKYFPKVQVSE
jgi:2-polyprenyl-3-methyl-5-hydroxy-6-metoxy-1,4-benzoquinol methylase